MRTLKEIDGDLINHWYILALESEVTACKPIRRELYDVTYVLFRDEKNNIAVLPDRCLHRGAQLSEGDVINGQVRCPYHGWVYNSEGQVTEIPSDGPLTKDSESSERRKGFCHVKTPVIVQDGCVWIWPGQPQLKTKIPPWRFPEFSSAKVSQYFMITDFVNEVTHLVENFMDVPHTVFVHSGWFRRRALLKVPMQVMVGAARVRVSYHQSSDSIGFTGKVLNPKNEKMFHTDEFIFPNITRVDYKFGNKYFIINSQCSPISRYKSRVYTWIAYDIGFLSKLLLPFFKFYTRQVIKQDVTIMKNQGDNLKSHQNFDFKSTQADELHLAIDRMRAQGVIDRNSAVNMNYTKDREFWI